MNIVRSRLEIVDRLEYLKHHLSNKVVKKDDLHERWLFMKDLESEIRTLEWVLGRD